MAGREKIGGESVIPGTDDGEPKPINRIGRVLQKISMVGPGVVFREIISGWVLQNGGEWLEIDAWLGRMDQRGHRQESQNPAGFH